MGVPNFILEMGAMKYLAMLAGLSALAVTAPLAGQEQQMPRFFAEGLGAAVVPTFGIADVAKTGGGFGATVGYALSPRWVVMGEFDYGMHGSAVVGGGDVNTLHYVGKVGYSLTGWRASGWEALVNLGAGAVAFDIQGAPKTYTYFAINAGAKLAYNFDRRVALVVSPQGDIAFSKRSELTTTNAWVWPFTAGVRVRF